MFSGCVQVVIFVCFFLTRGKICHDLRSVSCIVSSFPVLFSILTSLSFQVTCPSYCVKCLIVFPDSQSVSTCSPWSLVCSNSLRLHVFRASMLSLSMCLITSLFFEPQPQPGRGSSWLCFAVRRIASLPVTLCVHCDISCSSRTT